MLCGINFSLTFTFSPHRCFGVKKPILASFLSSVRYVHIYYMFDEQKFPIKIQKFPIYILVYFGVQHRFKK